MAEMTTLTAALYRNYSTSIKPDLENVAPGVTSRFEVFHDDTLDKVSVSWLLEHGHTNHLILISGTRMLDRVPRAMILPHYGRRRALRKHSYTFHHPR
jgi:hypothetical protein